MKNTISNLGYLDYSPYRFNPYNIINSNNITMNGVSKNLLLIPNKGKSVFAKANSGNYYFPNASRVTEIPIYQKAGTVYDNPIFDTRLLQKQNYSSDSRMIENLKMAAEQVKKQKGKENFVKQQYVSQGNPKSKLDILKNSELNKQYVYSHPYSKLNNNGDIEQKYPDRNIDGTAVPYSNAAKLDRGLNTLSNGIDAASILTGLYGLGKYAIRNAPEVIRNISNIEKGSRGVDDLGIFTMKGKNTIDATKAGSKVLNKKEGLNKIDNILEESNQLPEPPHEIILDQPSNYIETINLKRQGVKNNKIMPSFDDVDLGNDLTLRNNPSRVINKNDILGKNRALVSVKNKKTNEYIDLKSWEDEGGKIYYYMSASMPSSKIKAGRAYMELEKHIPKGESLLENSSLSYDSFLNILKQTKNPKFETFVKGRIPMNDMAVSNKLKSIGNKTSDSIDLGFYNKELADNAVNELNILIDKYNLPKATVVKRTVSTQPAAHLPYEKKDIFEIELPNIGLKKLYSAIGLTATGKYLQSQNQNKYGGLNSYQKGGQYEASEEEIQNLINKGYKIRYV